MHRKFLGFGGILFLAFFFVQPPLFAGSIVPGVDSAIAAVYPSLVQILVVDLDYDAGRAQKFQAAGSGVIISADGYVITNHHVAGRATSIRCVLTTKQQLNATLVGTDALTDIAVLKLDLSDAPNLKGKLPFARFGSKDTIKIGDPVLAMGCPLALSQSVTRGVVANKEMIFSRFMGPMILDGEDVGLLVKWIAHDAQILPGNSGGALVNLRGEIIGINEINVGGLGGGGLGGAIPSELAQSVAQQLIAKGRVARSWIGADFQPMLKGAASKTGVLLAGIIPGSPAEQAGLRAGDIITSINGAAIDVRFPEQLPPVNRMILSTPIGSTIQLTVLRDEKKTSFAIPTTAREDAQPKEQESKEWGFVVQDLTQMASRELHLDGRKGILIGSIRAGGPSDQSNPPLQAGDLIESIGGVPVPDRETFAKITSKITNDQPGAVPTTVTFRRRSEDLMTVVDVGIRTPQSPTPEARKAWLPVETQVLSRKLAAALGLAGKKGVRITNVYPGSTAEAAGLRVGDVITQMDGQNIDASETQDSTVFETMVRAYRESSKPQFTVIREGKSMLIPVALSQQPKPDREYPLYQNVRLEFKARDLSYTDRTDRSLDSDVNGAVVTSVERGGWASIGGLVEGDIIQGVNGSPVRSIDDLKTLLDAAGGQNSKYVVILVKRGIRTQFLELQPVWPDTAGGK